MKNGKKKKASKGRTRIKSTRKSGFSLETRKEAQERSNNKCETPDCNNLTQIGGEHHCLPRSQYSKDDRNELWNCGNPCNDCHREITSPKNDNEIRKRRYFELMALARRDGSNEKQLLKITKKYLNGSLELIQPKYKF